MVRLLKYLTNALTICVPSLSCLETKLMKIYWFLSVYLKMSIQYIDWCMLKRIPQDVYAIFWLMHTKTHTPGWECNILIDPYKKRIPQNEYVIFWLMHTKTHTPGWVFFFFVALCPKSTAMVMAGRSVHLTTLFSWASLYKQLTSTSCTYFCL